MAKSSKDKNLKDKKIWLKILITWTPLALVITLVLGTVYLLCQQVYRMSANDPQIQISEDIANKLSQGTPLKNVLPAERVDMSKSLSTYVMLFDDSGNLLATNTTINGAVPSFPIGVLDYSRAHGQDRVTWQPESNIRQATVVTYFNGASSGFVLVGRSLREVEIRENNLLFIVGFAWFFSLAAVLIMIIFLKIFFFRNIKNIRGR